MKILSSLKGFLMKRLEAGKRVTSNLCLGISMSLFFSVFVTPSQPWAYYWDRWEWLGRVEHYLLPIPAEDENLWIRLLGGFAFWGFAILFQGSNKKEEK